MMMEVFEAYAAMWAPAVAAIGGIIAAAIGMIAKVKAAAEKISNEATNKEINQKYEEITVKLSGILQENIELEKANYELKRLLTRVEDAGKIVQKESKNVRNH